MDKRLLVASFVIILSCLAGQVAVATVSYGSYGEVIFKPNTEITLPNDPTVPGQVVTPIDPSHHDQPSGTGQKGPLSIDFVSNFDFGVHQISTENQQYFAKAQTYRDKTNPTAAYVQVSDHRGTAAGWSLTVKQTDPFQAAEAVNYPKLIGVLVRLAQPVVNSSVTDTSPPVASPTVDVFPSSEVLVMQAAKNSGAGTWTVVFGKVKNQLLTTANGTRQSQAVSSGVSLFVPGKTPKSATTYTTTFNWNLKETPANGSN